MEKKLRIDKGADSIGDWCNAPLDAESGAVVGFSITRTLYSVTTGARMTRLDLLGLLVGQARANGFPFRKWYCARLGLPWISSNHALRILSEERRYYALLFSHEFAQSFWKAGEKITFLVPTQTFLRNRPDGSVMTVTRKGYTRRSGREDSWRYHLREIAVQQEPLRYMRRYLKIDDEMEEDG